MELWHLQGYQQRRKKPAWHHERPSHGWFKRKRKEKRIIYEPNTLAQRYEHCFSFEVAGSTNFSNNEVVRTRII